MWVARTIAIEQGSAFTRTWLFYDQDAAGLYAQFGNPADLVPHDFTGATLKMQVRQAEDPSSTLIDTYSTATGELALTGAGVANLQPGPAAPAYNNGYVLVLTGARSLPYLAGQYFYDLFATVAGVPKRIQAGPYVVIPTQTR